MKKIVAYSFLAFLIVNCGGFGKPKKPENLISKNDMVTILVDLALLSSAKGVNKKTLENAGISPEDYVYKTHNIDSLQFLNSNKYYAYYNEDYDAILKRVEDSLKTLKKKYTEIVDKNGTQILLDKQVKSKRTGKDSIRQKTRTAN